MMDILDSIASASIWREVFQKKVKYLLYEIRTNDLRTKVRNRVHAKKRFTPGVQLCTGQAGEPPMVARAGG